MTSDLDVTRGELEEYVTSDLMLPEENSKNM